MSVATEEAARWTDYTYQVIQFIRESDVSFQAIHNYFPYLKNTDCSLLMHEEDGEEEETIIAEPDGWSSIPP